MHVCFLARNFDARQYGGQIGPAIDLGREFLRRGIDVSIISTRSGETTTSTPSDLPVIFVPYRKRLPNNVRILAGSFDLYRYARNLHHQHPITVIHALEREFAGLAARTLSKKFRIPYVVTMYDRGFTTQWAYIRSVRPFPVKYLEACYIWVAERIILRSATAITAGPDVMGELRKRGVSVERLHEYGTTVNTDIFKPDAISRVRRELAIRGPIVLLVSRIDPLKGVDVFIRSIPKILEVFPATTFLIVGGDKDGFTPRYKKIANELRVSSAIRWLGVQFDLSQYYVAADCVVVPTRSVGGGVSTALLEAMACGRPVIATRVAAVPYLINDGQNGLLVSDGDFRGIASAVLRCLQQEINPMMGTEARRTVVTHYSISKVADQLQVLYERLMSSSSVAQIL